MFSLSLPRYLIVSSDTGSGQGGVGKRQGGCGWLSCMGAHSWKAPKVPGLVSDLKTLAENSLHAVASGVSWFSNKASQNMFVF